MTKNFVASVVIGVLVLIVFSYFVFGLNGSSSNNSGSTNLPQTSPSQPQSQPKDTGKIQITDEKVGTGAVAKKGDTVEVNYVGTLTNGKQFDSSYDRNQSFDFQLGAGQVIQGWDEGVVGMKVGGKRKLVIPPSLGYGSQATGSIPPNSTLIFEIELIKIK